MISWAWSCRNCIIQYLKVTKVIKISPSSEQLLIASRMIWIQRLRSSADLQINSYISGSVLLWQMRYIPLLSFVSPFSRTISLAKLITLDFKLNTQTRMTNYYTAGNTIFKSTNIMAFYWKATPRISARCTWFLQWHLIARCYGTLLKNNS